MSFNASWCFSTWQVEKRLKVQLTSVEQQQLNVQEVLKEKQNQLEKLQAQLKTVQGSFEVETKKLKGQIAELQENGAKMASWNLKWIHKPDLYQLSFLSAKLKIIFNANFMFVDMFVGRKWKSTSDTGVRTERRTNFQEVSHNRTAKGFGAKPGKSQQAAVWLLRQGVWSVCPSSRPEGTWERTHKCAVFMGRFKRFSLIYLMSLIRIRLNSG